MKGSSAQVTVGDDRVVLRRQGRSHQIVAGILEVERNTDGQPVRLVLDRRIHRTDETVLGEWAVSGPWVTELISTRP